ncbi:annexin A7-like [Scylla paramamosain]|uniref:annexin A7-like n=1 Tax=Scylla paramamosain TaxID=85552 RepID=UPI0030828384
MGNVCSVDASNTPQPRALPSSTWGHRHILLHRGLLLTPRRQGLPPTPLRQEHRPTPPAPGVSPYPPAPGASPYPPAPGASPYPPAPGAGAYPPTGASTYPPASGAPGYPPATAAQGYPPASGAPSYPPAPSGAPYGQPPAQPAAQSYGGGMPQKQQHYETGAPCGGSLLAYRVSTDAILCYSSPLPHPHPSLDPAHLGERRSIRGCFCPLHLPLSAPSLAIAHCL